MHGIDHDETRWVKVREPKESSPLNTGFINDFLLRLLILSLSVSFSSILKFRLCSSSPSMDIRIPKPMALVSTMTHGTHLGVFNRCEASRQGGHRLHKQAQIIQPNRKNIHMYEKNAHQGTRIFPTRQPGV